MFPPAANRPRFPEPSAFHSTNQGNEQNAPHNQRCRRFVSRGADRIKDSTFYSLRGIAVESVAWQSPHHRAGGGGFLEQFVFNPCERAAANGKSRSAGRQRCADAPSARWQLARQLDTLAPMVPRT